MNRLKEKYVKEIVPSLMNKYNYKSIMEVPKLDKVVINMGVGDGASNAKSLDKSQLLQKLRSQLLDLKSEKVKKSDVK